MELSTLYSNTAHTLNANYKIYQYGHLFDTLDILLVGEEKTMQFIEKMIQTVSNHLSNLKRLILVWMKAYMLGRGQILR